MNVIVVLYHRWLVLKPFNFIIITGLLMILCSIPIGYLFQLFGFKISDLGGFETDVISLLGLIILTVIIAPIFETIMAQLIPIYLAQKFFRQNSHNVGLIASILIFSLLHVSYSIWYAILVVPSGFFLAKSYLIFQDRKESSFWITSFIHAFRNSISVVIIAMERFFLH